MILPSFRFPRVTISKVTIYVDENRVRGTKREEEKNVEEEEEDNEEKEFA